MAEVMFIDEVPAVEIIDGLVVRVSSCGTEQAMPLEVFRKYMELGQSRLNSLEEAQPE
jgi:hypothetical protein